MNSIRKYKSILAAILLVVYAFIATPVQLWHYHNYKSGNESENSTTKKIESTVLKSAEQFTDVNCQICSHNYSVYKEVADIVFKIPSQILAQNKECYLFSIPLSPILSLSNKGPPAIA